MVKNISVCIFAFLLMACSTPQIREDIVPVEVVPPPVKAENVPVEKLRLPDNVSIRDTERGKILVIDPSIIHFYHAKVMMYKGYENAFLLTEDVLDMNPSVNMILEGHTSNPGNAYLYNYNLSVNRAKASFNYLKNLGVNGNRLTVVGLGEGLPEYNTAAKNRRLEFVIIENQNDLNTYQNYIKNVDIKKEVY